MGKKGQAAITDALYFLTIVSSLCIFLFIFATGYGNSVGQSIKDRYLEEFEASALKTILYSSMPRESLGTVLPNEVDFLLAAVKEDFADDQSLGETQMILLKDINAVMLSKSDSFDYIFYIYSEEFPDNRFPYFLFYRSILPEGDKIPGIVGGLTADCKANPDACGHLFYFCSPKRLDDIDKLLIGVSGVPPTKNRVKLVRLEALGAGDATTFKLKPFSAEAFLKMWPSTEIDLDAWTNLDCCVVGSAGCFAGNRNPAAAPSP